MIIIIIIYMPHDYIMWHLKWLVFLFNFFFYWFRGHHRVKLFWKCVSKLGFPSELTIRSRGPVSWWSDRGNGHRGFTGYHSRFRMQQVGNSFNEKFRRPPLCRFLWPSIVDINKILCARIFSLLKSIGVKIYGWNNVYSVRLIQALTVEVNDVFPCTWSCLLQWARFSWQLLWFWWIPMFGELIICALQYWFFFQFIILS